MKTTSSILFIFLIALSTLAPLIQVHAQQNDQNYAERLKQVAFSQHWLRLLHYMPPDYKSELDGSEFFFAADGRTNPLSELQASLQAMSESREIGRLKLHPQCAFPERFRFLQTTFDLKIKKVECPKLKEFLDRFHGAKAVSVIFSSAYPNNPSSMFGHTFLKFESNRKSDLLDYGVNYAAGIPPGESAFAFMYFGVAGGYKGQWSMEPYFTKVNTYINSESRDLWEYELTMTEDETQRLLAHLWELEITSYFDYYFFDKNCSYQILRAIEAIRPDWSLAHHNIYVIPGETIKKLYDQPGLVKNVNYRPSLYHQLQLQYENLTPKEKDTFLQTLSREPQQVKAAELTTRELDTSLLALKYFKMKKKKSFTDEDQQKENQLLDERLKRPEAAINLPIPDNFKRSRPELGHDPYSLTPIMGVNDGDEIETQEFFGLRLKSAYHDLLAKDDGFAPFSEIDFPWVEVRYKDNKLKVHQVGAVNITSLFPTSRLEKQISWRINLMFDTDQTLACRDCLLLRGEAGGGLAFGNRNARYYLFALMRQEFHHRLNKGYRSRPGIESSWVWRPPTKNQNYKMRFTALAFTDIDPEPSHSRLFEFNWSHAYSLKRNSEVRFSTILSYTEEVSSPDLTQAKIEWLNYFD